MLPRFNQVEYFVLLSPLSRHARNESRLLSNFHFFPLCYTSEFSLLSGLTCDFCLCSRKFHLRSLFITLPVWKPCLIRAGETLAKQRKRFTLGFHRCWNINLLAVVEQDIMYPCFVLFDKRKE